MSEKVIYTIPAIHCGHCVHTIKMEVGELEGVQSVIVDQDTKKATIQFQPPTTKEKIEELLQEINYPPEQLLRLS